ncbi:MAG: IS21 family transposase [Bacteroidota bacterium]|nr:IS21 family transposase [Bacteroidota bacterium]
MANKVKSMLQIRRIIQLTIQGEGGREINRITGVHRKTISNYLERLQLTGKDYPELLSLKDAELAELVYPKKTEEEPNKRLKDFYLEVRKYKEDLIKCKGMTRKRLWERHLAKYPESYSYTQFCEHFARYLNTSDPTMVMSHRPGDVMQIDFAGKNLEYIDRSTGEIIPCPTLVCSLPYSSIAYVEPLLTARLEHLIPALSRTVTYFDGVTRVVLTDNMKQTVIRACRYEPTFTELAEQWAVHYDTFLKATRVRKPKDKPTVEKTVDLIYQNIYAPLYEEEIYSHEELFDRVMELLDVFNNRPMYRNLPSRMECFLKEEKPFLKKLPSEPFVLKHRTNAKVKKNYHVILGEDWHQYSVPYQYIGKQIAMIYDDQEVEVYLGFKRIAVHMRNTRENGYTTLAEHMPESHQKYKEQKGWDGDDFIESAKRIGEHTERIMERILSSRTFMEQTYDACLGVLRLAGKYGSDRLESACKRARQGSRVNYTIIKNILQNNQDKIPFAEDQTLPFLPDHENIRGPETYR